MQIQILNTTHSPLYSFFKEVYLASFPIEEQRPLESIEKLIAERDIFSLIIFLSDNTSVGFFTLWNLGDFYYGEHFAIHENHRSGGIGSSALKTLLASLDKPLVLEVEPPTEPMAIRRIGFYERHDFKMSDYDYVQPPYTPDMPSLPLKLMEYGGNLLEENAQAVERKIHTIIYGRANT